MTYALYRALAEDIQRVEFDMPFTIGGDDPLVVVERADVDAPSVYHADGVEDVHIDGDGWETVTDGMSGQWGYSGPVMHASEFIGHRLAEHMADDYERGTVFVVTSVEDMDDSDSPAGWVILRQR